MSLYFRPLIGLCCLLAPFTLHSTDIHHSSNGSVRIEANLNQHIIPGDPKLGSSIFVVSAPSDIASVRLDTACEHMEETLYTGTGKDLSRIFVLRANFPTPCDTKTASVSDGISVFTDTEFSLPVIGETQILQGLINYAGDDLTALMRDDFQKAQELDTQISAFSWNTLVSKLTHINNLYQKAYLEKRSDLARSILNDREHLTYISPVAGYALPTKDILIPGANRGYRKDTTDGVHHGWDIMAPYGTPVRSLAKGIIIRVKSDWSWADFNRLKKRDLSEDDRLRNLDIYRGNQVWLQTMDGNVTFYSHLSKISSEIQVGSVVEAGTPLGNIGRSGVPDKNYQNLHLHFEVQQNPHLHTEETLSNLDIMRWAYTGKNEPRSIVRSETNALFH